MQEKESMIVVEPEPKRFPWNLVIIIAIIAVVLLIALIVLFFIYIIENNNLPPENLTNNYSETDINNNFSVTNLTDINGTPINYTQNKTEPDDKDKIENETITPITCINDTGCNSAGSFCDGSMIYTCSLGTDGCFDRVNGANCGSGEYCSLGSCVAVTGRIIYVDKMNLSGYGCDNNWNGSFTSPKCDVNANWFRYDLEPGDTIIFREAIYSPMFFNESSSGTENNPVTIKAYNGEKIFLDNGDSNSAQLWFWNNASYINIEGPVKITYSTYPAITRGNNTGIKLHNIEVDNSDCDNGVRTARDCRGINLGSSTNSELKNAKIIHLQGCCGIAAYYTNNALFENIEIYDVDDGKGANGDADGVVANYADNLTFINVSSHNNSEDGFDLGSNSAIINSKAYDNTGAGIKIWRRIDDGYARKTLKIINSLIYHNGFEAVETSESGNPGIKASQGAELQVYNSVIYGNHDEGIALRGYNTTVETAYSVIYNSIISNNGYEGIGVDQSAYPNPGFNNVSAGNNIYFNNASANNGLQSDIDSFNENPLFVDVANNNFKPQAGSPAINKGNDLSSIFSYDIEGRARPQGMAWDIGAYEY